MLQKSSNKIRKKQGSPEKVVLFLILLLLLFWKEVRSAIKSNFCECSHENQNENNQDNSINIPETATQMFKESTEISKELFERQNDVDVLDLSDTELQKQFFPENGILKLTQNAIHS